MQRGSIFPLLLIIVLAAVVLCGVFYYQFVQEKSSYVPVNPKPSPKPREIVNDSLGLKFEIPERYRLKKETEQEYFKRANGNIRKNFNYYILYNPPEFAQAFYLISNSETNLDKATLTVWVFENPENLDAQSFYKKYWYYPFVWGDFTEGKNKIAPENIELIGGKEGKFGIVDYREGKPKIIYLALGGKGLMVQIQLSSEGNEIGKKILESFKFD